MSDLLKSTVNEGGYCIGCGACASYSGSPFQMKFDEFGKFVAAASRPTSISDNGVSSLCPFSKDATNEDALAKSLFSPDCSQDSGLGSYLDIFAGYVAADGFRKRASSGGGVSWFLSELLSRGQVDGVIHVRSRLPSTGSSPLVEYGISTTAEEIAAGAKSKYYPVEISKVIQQVRDRPGRYVFVGIPCFIKAVRLLTAADDALRARIIFCVGIVCGHLKSAKYAEMFGWQLGIRPGNLHSFDFRVKMPGFNASSYAVQAEGVIEDEVVKLRAPAHLFFGYDWGVGLFKYKACDFCDDVFAETADISFGDAWLDNYDKDWKGNNVVVVRNSQCLKLIKEGIQSGALQFERLSSAKAVESQSAGLRHRRQGLAYRLQLADRNNEWRPSKRVQAGNGKLGFRERRKYRLRSLMASLSHRAFQQAVAADDFHVFVRQMQPLIEKYRQSLKPSLWKRCLGRLFRILKRAR